MPCTALSPPLLRKRPHLGYGLLSNGAWAALASVKSLLHREATSMGFESLHQQVIDSSKVVVALVLQRLEKKSTRVCVWPNVCYLFCSVRPGIRKSCQLGKKKIFKRCPSRQTLF